MSRGATCFSKFVFRSFDSRYQLLLMMETSGRTTKLTKNRTLLNRHFRKRILSGRFKHDHAWQSFQV
ncbi:hypothetical protein HanIR_Chr01g0030821 [Helianthus annuus]|nr:hypothetical protein HanIR_Chr01g0030821 [Helianthus annuus]